MTGKIVIKSSSAINRRQPLLPPKPLSVSSSGSSPPLPSPTLQQPNQSSREKRSLGEFAGGAAAECAAVCCCCPFVLVDFIVLAFYKVPTGLCRRVLRKRLMKMQKKKMTKMGLLHCHHRGGAVTSLFDVVCSEVDLRDFEMVKLSIDGSAEVIDLDKEMWNQFQNTGFWRSPSQRDQ